MSRVLRWLPARGVDLVGGTWVRGWEKHPKDGHPFEGRIVDRHGAGRRFIVTVLAEPDQRRIVVPHTLLRVRR